MGQGPVGQGRGSSSASAATAPFRTRPSQRPKKKVPDYVHVADPGGMEIKGLNPELNDMVLRGQLSGRKLAELIRLKEIADRFATCNYVSEEELAVLVDKYGTGPDIVTWGDYFQTEVGSQYFAHSDPDFATIVDTIRFDLISAVKIFQGKSPAFLEKVQTDGLAAYGTPREEWTSVEEERAHLYILLNYFRELGMAETCLSSEDEKWFEGFLAAEQLNVVGHQA
jgi:hypothetical protein